MHSTPNWVNTYAIPNGAYYVVLTNSSLTDNGIYQLEIGEMTEAVPYYESYTTNEKPFDGIGHYPPMEYPALAKIFQMLILQLAFNQIHISAHGVEHQITLNF